MASHQIPTDNDMSKKTDVAVVNNAIYSGSLISQDLGTDKAHPLEEPQSKGLAIQHQNEMERMRAVHGLHAVMHLEMERSVALQTRRLCGLPSSMIGLETLMDLDTDIRPQDYLSNTDARLAIQQRREHGRNALGVIE